MQRKLISLLHCQLVEGDGRLKAVKFCRSIGERITSELLLKHQDPYTLSANLWAAVRSRGCQFLGKSGVFFDLPISVGKSNALKL